MKPMPGMKQMARFICGVSLLVVACFQLSRPLRYEILQFRADNTTGKIEIEYGAPAGPSASGSPADILMMATAEEPTLLGNKKIVAAELFPRLPPALMCKNGSSTKFQPDNFDPVLSKELFARVVTHGEDILRILNAHGIQYVPEGGSFIGLVRHQGMIPWDDDGDFYLQKNETSIRAMLLKVLPKVMWQGFQVRMDIPVKTYKLSRTKDPNKFKFFRTSEGLLKNHGGRNAISNRTAPLPDINYFKIRHESWSSKVYFEFRTFCDSADGRHIILNCGNPHRHYKIRKISSSTFYPLQHLPWHNTAMMAPANLAVYWAEGISKTIHGARYHGEWADNSTKNIYDHMLSNAFIAGSSEHGIKWKRKAETRALTAIPYLACYDPKHYKDTLPWRKKFKGWGYVSSFYKHT